jgi:DNA ligase-1
LRFPRFIKVRDDKNIEQASNPEFLAEMWKNQQGKGSDQGGADDGDLLDIDSEEQVEEESDA